jgi:hypothetical protein
LFGAFQCFKIVWNTSMLCILPSSAQYRSPPLSHARRGSTTPPCGSWHARAHALTRARGFINSSRRGSTGQGQPGRGPGEGAGPGAGPFVEEGRKGDGDARQWAPFHNWCCLRFTHVEYLIGHDQWIEFLPSFSQNRV